MSGFFVLDKAYKAYLDSVGIDGELIFKKAGLSFSGFEGDKIKLNREQYIAFMNSLDKHMCDGDILAISKVDQLVVFVPPLFAALCARNGHRCFERLSKYKKLIGPFKLKIRKTNKSVDLEFTFDDDGIEIPRFAVLTEQILITSLIRKATGKHIVPLCVSSQYQYGDGILEAYLGVRPTHSKSNKLSFDLKDMEEPFLTKNNMMWEYLEPEFKKRIKEFEMDNSVAAKVRSALVELIPAGEDGIESLANRFAMSPRTLQRKLSSEGTSFIKQLNHTRELMARNYLKDDSISNDEIAFLIGYSDVNAFARAFRGWTGMTIGVYRKKYCA